MGENVTQVRLGRTNERVAAIGLGTWAHGGPKVVGKRPVGWSGHAEEPAREALVRAWELGLRHWDTADAYGGGRAEELIGSLWSRVPREEIFLASKVGWEPGPYDHYYDPRQIRAQLEGSLQRLRTDRIDLYYLHHCNFGPDDRQLEGAVELLRLFRREGKIRFIGLSDWSAARIVRYAPRVEPEVVQVYRNVVDDDYHSSGLAAWVESADAGVAFFSPLRHGLLLGKHGSSPDFGEGDHRSRIPAFRDEAVLARMRRCRQEVEERLRGQSEPLLRALVGALLVDEPNACALVGMRAPSHVEAAARCAPSLSSEEAAWVRELYRAGS